MSATLLVELGTEELPPRALPALSAAFGSHVRTALESAGLEFGYVSLHATPRRLAISIEALAERQPDRVEQRRGPAVRAAFDDAGAPTKAALGFARSCGVDVSELGRTSDGKGEWLAYELRVPGRPVEALVPEIVTDALAALPIPKRMRWGAGSAEFVRPVHWLVAMYGTRVIECEILGARAGRVTRGHRFHHPDPIELNDANAYAAALASPGHVVTDFAERRRRVLAAVEAAAQAHNGTALVADELLDEVTALVEWPVAVTGSFDTHFLELPDEVLIASMQDHQKYFPVTAADGTLLNRFVTVSNLDSREPDTVRDGNERVIRPRLADAGFFWKTDRAHTLASRAAALDAMLFEKRLGSLADKTQRITALARSLAPTFGADPDAVARAAALSRCDLLSEMVGEFPELQGTMGAYYARADGEPGVVCDALGEFYSPRFAGDALPSTPAGQCLAVADRLDSLVGIFGIGAAPTGDKDPFALRRAAIGVVRILIERGVDLDLRDALDAAVQTHEWLDIAEDSAEQVFAFVRDRMRGYLLDQGTTPDVCDAVLANDPSSPLEVSRRLAAVARFLEHDAADALAAANKRIANILKKADGNTGDPVVNDLLSEPQEQALAAAYDALSARSDALFSSGDYTAYMEAMAELRGPVDEFFDHVMVMCEDERVRANRIALLAALHRLFTRVADIARLNQ